MLTYPSSYSLEDVGVSQTMLTDFMTCPRRFLFRINRWRGPDSAMQFGSVVHEGLEQFYKGEDWESAVEKACGKDEMLKAMAHATLAAYVKHYAKADAKQYKFASQDDIEKIFEVTVDRVRRRGMIDGLALAPKATKTSKRRVIIEHKTRSQISEDKVAKRVSFDFQNGFYAEAVEALGYEVTGILYNLIRKPQLKQKAGETLKQFFDRLAADIDERPEFYFMRFEVELSSESKDEFRAELASAISRLGEYCFDAALSPDKAQSIFYKNSSACEAPFPCTYLDACASGTCESLTQDKTLFTELKKKQAKKAAHAAKVKD